MPTRGLIVLAFRLPLNRVSVWGLQSEKRHLGGLAGPSLRDCSSLSGVSVTVYLFIHSRSGALDQGRPRFLSASSDCGIRPVQLRGRSWQERRSAVSSHAQYFQQSNIFFFFVALLCFRKTLFSLTVFSC